jgi:hypothetical protein
LSRRLAVVIRAWTTRRLLWLWMFAYACVLASASRWPVSANDHYFECPRFFLPADAVNPATEMIGGQSRIKHLRDVRSLIVRDGVGSYGDLFGSRLTVRENVNDVRRSLNDLPNLESVYLGGYHNPVAFRRVCSQLPGIRVWHLDLNGGRLASKVFLLFATLTLGGAVLQQCQALFSLPQGRTFPGYVVPHLLVPMAIGAAGIGAATLVAGKFGTDLWTSAALQVFAWGAWSAFAFRVLAFPTIRRESRSSASNPGDLRSAKWRPDSGQIGGTLLLMAIAACCVTFIARPYVLESLLLGELPWLNVGFLLVGAILVSAVVIRAPLLSVATNEAGATPVLSAQDVEKRRVEHGLLPVRFERRLERLRRPTRMPLWLWQIYAMQSGNPDLLRLVLVRLVAPVVVVVALHFCLPLDAYGTIFVALLLGAGWFISISHIFSNWWQRRKAFSVQLLYPWTRGQLTRAAFAAYALDATGILALLLMTAIFCNLTLDWQLGRNAMLSGAVAIALAAALFITGGLWLLTLRHRLLAGFLAVFGVLVLILAMTWGGAFYRMDGARLWRVALPFALFAWLLGLDAWRRWMKTEWGLFGPL